MKDKRQNKEQYSELTTSLYYCSMTHKNPETEIGVQPDGQKSKNSQPLALTTNSVQHHDPASRKLRRLCLRAVSTHLIFLSTAGIKGMYHYPVCKAVHYSCFSL